MYKKIKQLKQIDHLEFIIFPVLSLLLIDSLEFFMLLGYIISVSIVICLFYTNFIRVNFVHRILFKNMILVNINMASVFILNFIGLIMVFYDVKMTYYFFIYSMQCILDFSQIQIILSLHNNKTLRLYINHIICVIIMILVVVVKSLISKNLISVYYFKILILITLFVSLKIISTGVKNIIRARNNFSHNQYKKLKIYIICTICSVIGFLLIGVGFTNIAIIFLVGKYLAHIDLYNFLLHKNLNDSLDLINMDIKRTLVEKRNLNRILNKRNSILCEKNKMIIKSKHKLRNVVNSVYAGVFVFLNNKLSYSNNQLNKFGFDNELIEGIDILVFFERYLNLNISKYIILDEEIKTFPEIKINNLIYEVNVICCGEKEKIVYIHDVTQLKENIKLKNELESCKEDDECKMAFYSNISHELKTPINMIYSAIQLNNIYLDDNKLDMFERNRKIIIKNSLRLIRTINNFIDANKLSEGYITPEINTYNIVELVENITIGCNKYVQQVGIDLIFDADQEDIFVNCDRDMIHRIILNIISNFVKYSECATYIKVHISLEDDKVIIKIKSDGKKINKDMIPFIFDKFTKINKAFNRLKEGSGLGMFLVKALVEIQKGEISISSKSKGNEFRIIFNRVSDVSYDEVVYESSEINALEEKIDVEFSDIYI